MKFLGHDRAESALYLVPHHGVTDRFGDNKPDTIRGIPLQLDRVLHGRRLECGHDNVPAPTTGAGT